jgi:hypothetical protein
MQDFQQRVVDEKVALDDKIVRLTHFTQQYNLFARLPVAEQNRLLRQLDVMQQYSGILKERIEAFAS